MLPSVPEVGGEGYTYATAKPCLRVWHWWIWPIFYLLICLVRVTTGDSGLCCCVHHCSCDLSQVLCFLMFGKCSESHSLFQIANIFMKVCHSVLFFISIPHGCHLCERVTFRSEYWWSPTSHTERWWRWWRNTDPNRPQMAGTFWTPGGGVSLTVQWTEPSVSDHTSSQHKIKWSVQMLLSWEVSVGGGGGGVWKTRVLRESCPTRQAAFLARPSIAGCYGNPETNAWVGL